MIRAALLGLLLLASPATAGAEESSAGTERGKYLVTVGGCNDCHTPWKMGEKGPAPDMTKMLSGHPAEMKITAPVKGIKPPWGWVGAMSMTAFSGPWGVSFAANLTPDETGLGTWSEKDFITAMREGKHKGTGRAILPPMPWFNLSKATDEDLSAIFTYLKSIPPVKNRVAMPVANPDAGKHAAK